MLLLHDAAPLSYYTQPASTAGSVVVSGNMPSKCGTHSLYCAVIVKKVDAKTLGKTGLNDLLRSID